MKIRIVIDKSFEEDEVVIKCRELNENIRELQKTISCISDGLKMVFYKNRPNTLCRLTVFCFLKPLAKE